MYIAQQVTEWSLEAFSLAAFFEASHSGICIHDWMIWGLGGLIFRCTK